MSRTRAAAHALAAFGLSMAAQAAPVTMVFSASDFQNSGTQYPGLAGPVHGSITWDRDQPSDPIGTLLDIDLEINGHAYSLDEVGIANEGSSMTAIGAKVRGANAVVGDGAFHDFLLVFDRVHPSISAFAYSVQGRTNAIWWNPANSQASIVAAAVPAPSAAWLAATALGALALRRRRPASAGPTAGALAA